MKAELKDGTQIRMHYGASNLPPDRTGMTVGIGLWCTAGDFWFRSPEKSSFKTRQILSQIENLPELYRQWEVDIEDALDVIREVESEDV